MSAREWTIEDLGVCEYGRKNQFALVQRDTRKILAIFQRQGPAKFVVRMVEASLAAYFPSNREIPDWPVESAIAVKILECLIRRDADAQN